MKNLIKDTLSFISKTHSPFHAINNIENLLIDNGFEKLSESRQFNIQRGGKYFITRNDSSLIAFSIGNENKFHIVATHSDSPTFKLKPNPIVNKSGYISLATEVYGGPIISSWFDRPLSIAGRLLVKENDKIVTKLVDIDDDICIIPNVCIHFNREINNGYKYNPSIDTYPLLSLSNVNDLYSLFGENNEVLGHDLYLYNRDEAKIIGPDKQLFASSKIDNLECSYLATRAFIDTNDNSVINVLAIFDNEEVGSDTIQGADSTFLDDILFRISIALNLNREQYLIALSKSFLVSADNAHAIHPNHPELSDSNNCPKMNQGIAIKFNAAQNYTSSGYSSALFIDVLKQNNVPYQFFANRSDIRGGGTLGSISSTHVSIQSVDIGCPQLSMHSSYEVAGLKDIEYMYQCLEAFYNSNI